jgi:hypothetical protein
LESDPDLCESTTLHKIVNTVKNFMINSRWWGEHSNSCGGTYTKVKEPEGFGKKKTKKGTTNSNNKVNNNTKGAAPKAIRGQPDIRSLLTSPAAGPSRAGSNAPGSNAPGSNAPGSNAPGSNAPGSNALGSRKVPPTSGGAAAQKSGGNIFGFGGTSYGSPGAGGREVTKVFFKNLTKFNKVILLFYKFVAKFIDNCHIQKVLKIYSVNC